MELDHSHPGEGTLFQTAGFLIVIYAQAAVFCLQGFTHLNIYNQMCL